VGNYVSENQRGEDRASVYMTTLDVGSFLSKSAGASFQPGSVQEQPSMLVATVKFGRAQGDGGHKIRSFLESWVCDEEKIFK